MIDYHPHHDHLLRERLESLSRANKDFWSFKGNSRREHGHGMFQYPAMMVPQAVEAILEQACAVHCDIERVGDPFSGSGTIMTESMMRGLAFSGTDINPLAVLLCKVKSGPFFINALRDKSIGLLDRIKADGRCAIEANFPTKDKWFSRDVQITLSKIRRAIRMEESLWARRFFWVALAEAARATSNSRTSTFKLHIRTQEDITTRLWEPQKAFEKALKRNLKHYETQAKKLSESGRILRGRYQRDIEISLADVRGAKGANDLDIVVTSPPYGDNATTVPYGQYSYLPLQWIDLQDIDRNVDEDCLKSTHEIDSRSLGGRKRVTKADIEELSARSPAFTNYLKSLNDQPIDRANRVTAFFRDLDTCLCSILQSLRPGGLMVWTLGNRKVGGKRVPLDQILTDLLYANNATSICDLKRRIPSKRMPSKNNISNTISDETILVMRKTI